MKAANLIKIVGVAVVVSGMAGSTAAADNAEETLVSCFASVHSECHGDGNVDCSEELYHQGVDWCVASYPGDDARASAERVKAEMSRRLKFMR